MRLSAIIMNQSHPLCFLPLHVIFCSQHAATYLAQQLTVGVSCSSSMQDKCVAPSEFMQLLPSPPLSDFSKLVAKKVHTKGTKYSVIACKKATHISPDGSRHFIERTINHIARSGESFIMKPERRQICYLPRKPRRDS